MAVLAVCLVGGRVDAATRFWSDTGTWNATNANWGTVSGGPYTSTWSNSAPDAATFEGTAGTVTLAMTATANGLTFNTTGYTVTGGTISFGGAVTVATSVTGTIESKLTGASAITKSGVGTLRLTNTTNDFTGELTFGSGVLEMASIPNSSNRIIFSGGTVRYVGASNSTTNRSIQFGTLGGTIIARIDSSGAGTINFSSSAAPINGGVTSAGTALRLQGVNTGDNYWRGRLNDLVGTPIALSKTDAGTWIVTGNSGFSGGTTISGGTLGFGSTTALGTGTVTFSANATLRAAVSGTLANRLSTGASSSITATVNTQANAVTLSGSISGAGNLTKVGSGTLTLSGSSGYTGATTVSVGRLSVNGSLGATAVSVASAATLGGSGSIGGPLSILTGGTLDPGNSIASLASGTTTFAAGATYAYEVDSTDVGVLSSAADLLVVSGDLNLDTGDGTLLTLSDLNPSPNVFVGNTTMFAMINYSGTWNGGLFSYDGNVLSDGERFTAGSQTWEIDYDRLSGAGLENFTADYLPSGSFVVITAVPEPSTYAMALAGITAGWAMRRRRRG